jgi:hypothetical protein
MSRSIKAPPCPPIDPALCYPIRRLSDWSFGSRGRAALIRAGLKVMQFGKLKFFMGSSLIATLAGETKGQEQ